MIASISVPVRWVDTRRWQSTTMLVRRLARVQSCWGSSYFRNANKSTRRGERDLDKRVCKVPTYEGTFVREFLFSVEVLGLIGVR